MHAMEHQLQELRRLAAKAGNRLTETGIPRVAMVQGKIPEHELAAVYDPMINLILQGSKSMTIGERTLHYCPANYFVMSVDLPAVGTVWPSESGEPYLAVALTLQPEVVATMIADLPGPARGEGSETGFSVAAVTPDLMDAWVRMLCLMEHPGDIPALAPVYEREILYRVLQGPQGWMLRDLAMPDTSLARVSLAIQIIRRDFAQPLRVEKLARAAAMSPSAFHRNFKSVTSLSPLQYQKQIRLLKARSLMLGAGRNVASAAFEVGYESATQFSREYARTFGAPPRRDAAMILAKYASPGESALAASNTG
jgi:AraC-like DNA-binding protein